LPEQPTGLEVTEFERVVVNDWNASESGESRPEKRGSLDLSVVWLAMLHAQGTHPQLSHQPVLRRLALHYLLSVH